MIITRLIADVDIQGDVELVIWVFGVDFVVDLLVEAFAVVDGEVDDDVETDSFIF